MNRKAPSRPGAVGVDGPGRLFVAAEIQAAIYACGLSGVGAERLLEGSRLDIADVLSGKRITASQCKFVHDRARRLTTASVDIAIGLHLGVGAFGTAGFAIMTAPGVTEAVDVLDRFGPLFNMRFDLGVSEQAVGLRIDFWHPKDLSAGLLDAGTARLEIVKVVRLLRDRFGDSFVPVAVSVGPEAGEQTDLADFTRAPLKPAPQPFLLLDNHTMRRAQSPTNLSAHRASVRLCEGLMGIIEKEPDVVRAVRQRLSSLQGGVPSPRVIAMSLHMSERTMRRRLQAHNRSYNRLRSEVRLKMAERFLGEGAMSTDLIAEQLGYTEATNFRHAFRRWTGSSPRRYQVDGQERVVGISNGLSATEIAKASSFG